MDDQQRLSRYRALIVDFLSGKLGAWDFTLQYQREFLDDQTTYGNPIYEVLNSIFMEAEAYSPSCTPEEERAAKGIWEITEQTLRQRVAESLPQLERFIAKL